MLDRIHFISKDRTCALLLAGEAAPRAPSPPSTGHGGDPAPPAETVPPLSCVASEPRLVFLGGTEGHNTTTAFDSLLVSKDGWYCWVRGDGDEATEAMPPDYAA